MTEFDGLQQAFCCYEKCTLEQAVTTSHDIVPSTPGKGTQYNNNLPGCSKTAGRRCLLATMEHTGLPDCVNIVICVGSDVLYDCQLLLYITNKWKAQNTSHCQHDDRQLHKGRA